MVKHPRNFEAAGVVGRSRSAEPFRCHHDGLGTCMISAVATQSDLVPSPRLAGARALATALNVARQDTLATFAAYQASIPGLNVPLGPCVNPPLWELGHVGWFQEYWISRNPQTAFGIEADPAAPRRAGVRAEADALYNSSLVPHDHRWSLALPDAQGTCADLDRQLEATLYELSRAGSDDASLYFFRLALLHEDMHHEAALYMAQALGVVIEDRRWWPRSVQQERHDIPIPPGHRHIGWAGLGFAFDNELQAHGEMVESFEIDSQAITWEDYLPFVEAGGYEDARWWSASGWRWRQTSQTRWPRYLQREQQRWWQARFGRVVALDPRETACHLSFHEVQAWCNWAGRRLPTEVEWETAAREEPGRFGWGHAWEWTASPFLPYPDFVAHPYVDYSQPWFDGRPVLRGASFGTQARMRDARYRNYFPADRNDIFSGFRTCKVKA